MLSRYQIQNPAFAETLYYSWGILIKEGFTTFMELKKMTLKDFYRLWDMARQLGTFDEVKNG